MNLSTRNLNESINEELTPLIIKQGTSYPPSPIPGSPPICWCCWESDTSNENPLIRACRNCKDKNLQLIHQECINKYISNLPSNDTKFQCTRCTDNYNVTLIKVHPLRVLVSDPFLWVSMCLLTLCVVVLTVCCSVLLNENWTSGSVLLAIGQFQISMVNFALFMMIFCHAVNFFTWKMVYGFCSGKTIKHIGAIQAVGDDLV